MHHHVFYLASRPFSSSGPDLSSVRPKEEPVLPPRSKVDERNDGYNALFMQARGKSPHDWASVFVRSIHSLVARVHWTASHQLLMHVVDAPGVGLASWQTLTPQPASSLEPIAGCVLQSRRRYSPLILFVMGFANHLTLGLSRLLCKSVAMRVIRIYRECELRSRF